MWSPIRKFIVKITRWFGFGRHKSKIAPVKTSVPLQLKDGRYSIAATGNLQRPLTARNERRLTAKAARKRNGR